MSPKDSTLIKTTEYNPDKVKRKGYGEGTPFKFKQKHIKQGENVASISNNSQKKPTYSLGSSVHPSVPNEPPKPGKGRIAIALVLLSFTSFIVYQLWTTFWRYEAYGITHVNRAVIHPPWEGNVVQLLVKPGDIVIAGQPLIEINNVDITRKSNQLVKELIEKTTTKTGRQVKANIKKKFMKQEERVLKTF